MGDSVAPPPPPPIVITFPVQTTIKPVVLQNLKNARADVRPETEAREAWRAVYQRRKYGDGNTYGLCHFHEAPSIVQDGPVCGLVALCMAGHQLGSTDIAVDEILTKAKYLGFTNNGEMFSAADMCTLAETLYTCRAKLVSEKSERWDQVIDALLRNKPVLIPYDRYGNNEPCCKKGHKAHWAVLLGLLVCVESVSTALMANYDVDREESGLLLAHTPHEAGGLRDLTRNKESGSVYVFAKQGKSVHTHLWCLHQLLESNSNLRELDPQIAAHVEHYVVSSTSVEQGLCNQLVILHRDPS